jgi:hypothetical protein
MISLCLPSRKRSSYFLNMCKSALDNAYDKNNIEFVTFRDSDDRTPYTYIGNHKEVIGTRTTEIFQMWNECQKIATGPIYMYIADDFILTSKDWDKEVMEEFDKYPDKIVVLEVDNGRIIWEKYGFSGLGFVHKNWVDTVGYLFPNYFYPNNADKWVNDLAVAIGRRVRLKMTCEDTMYKVRDAVHYGKTKLVSHWRRTYNQDFAVEQRKKDADKLQAAINSYGIGCPYRGTL